MDAKKKTSRMVSSCCNHVAISAYNFPFHRPLQRAQPLHTLYARREWIHIMRAYLSLLAGSYNMLAQQFMRFGYVLLVQHIRFGKRINRLIIFGIRCSPLSIKLTILFCKSLFVYPPYCPFSAFSFTTTRSPTSTCIGSNPIFTTARLPRSSITSPTW